MMMMMMMILIIIIVKEITNIIILIKINNITITMRFIITNLRTKRVSSRDDLVVWRVYCLLGVTWTTYRANQQE